MTSTDSGKYLNLAVIVGSVRQGRFGPVAARWFAGQAERYGRFTVDVIDLADVPPWWSRRTTTAASPPP